MTPREAIGQIEDLPARYAALVAVAALDAVGVTDGVSHVEIRIVDGRPRLIEVNARIAGDMIGHLVHLATGVDLARAAADIACGMLHDLTPTHSQAAAIRLIYPAYPGTLAERRMDAQFADSTDWLERVTFHRDAGDRLVLPPDGNMYSARIGYLITVGPSAEAAKTRSTEAYRHLTVRVAAGEETGAAT